ncbi:VOC family protein [Micromonospora radicis]|uniref:Glyoxalase/bleomycin resistance/dioxygenase family protein n=1 Tax=Micromonospora radicis TaxID=1894971 RepID=A0A418N214_9ACTN|nr:VOC family protein [Micromonospora radicis]RIV41643.1 glyoxalase/bleomycin resistance/dioxygenase family protein [Micromonospora radicis]
MPQLAAIVIHCRDPYLIAPFWSTVTGLPIVPDDLKKLAERALGPAESVLLGASTGDGLHIWVAPAEELPPVGRIHLDLAIGDGELDAILAAGATVVRTLPRWTVLADPEGNEFCVFRRP